eukprot:SAG31_NODE_844_length_11549_cov_2.985852_1_plen_318_part_00
MQVAERLRRANRWDELIYEQLSQSENEKYRCCTPLRHRPDHRSGEKQQCFSPWESYRDSGPLSCDLSSATPTRSSDFSSGRASMPFTPTQSPPSSIPTSSIRESANTATDARMQAICQWDACIEKAGRTIRLEQLRQIRIAARVALQSRQHENEIAEEKNKKPDVQSSDIQRVGQSSRVSYDEQAPNLISATVVRSGSQDQLRDSDPFDLPSPPTLTRIRRMENVAGGRSRRIEGWQLQTEPGSAVDMSSPLYSQAVAFKGNTTCGSEADSKEVPEFSTDRWNAHLADAAVAVVAQNCAWNALRQSTSSFLSAALAK